ncbi:cell division protein FtsW [Candidatus Uhrbacteria bacterium]|nr:cell division protein FtsW [Candidatus Uhrbacteria bacterium]
MIRRPDYLLLSLLAAIVAVGFVILTSASGPVAFQKFGDAYWYVKHQAIFGLIPGLFLFWISARLDYRVWRRLATPILIVSLALLAAVFLPGIGAEWGTTRSWINIGGYSFQPAEFTKLALLAYMAAWFDRRGERGFIDLSQGLLGFLAVLGLASIMIMLQPDLGSFSVIGTMAVIVYFVAGAPWSHLAGLAVGGVALIGALIKAAPYRAARFMTFLHPELDPRGVGYHINQALLAIGSGGIVGLGLGHSRQKYLYLPEVVSDSIFAVMAEELGFILTLAFLVLAAALILRCASIARRAPDRFGRLLVAGVCGWIFAQTIFNIGSMVGLLPLTGLPLPFVSYGGSALMVTLAAMGMVVNVSGQAVETVYKKG